MKEQQVITNEYFIKRLTDLCLRSGLTGYPTNITDQHILYKSAVLSMNPTGVFTEKEINENLKYWIDIVRIKGIDYGTLRRRLVDSGYLTRNKDGSCYKIAISRPGQPIFEESIAEIDVAVVIQGGWEVIARRKREYLEKVRHTED